MNDAEVAEALKWAEAELPPWLNTAGPNYAVQEKENRLKHVLAAAHRYLVGQLDDMARCYACSRMSNSARSQCHDCWKAIELRANAAESKLAQAIAERDEARTQRETFKAQWEHSARERFKDNQAAEKRLADQEVRYLDVTRSLEDRVRAAEEERDEAKRQLDYMAQGIYRGNTISYIYDKMACYGDQVMMAFNALRLLGWVDKSNGNAERKIALEAWSKEMRKQIDAYPINAQGEKL